MMPRMIRHLASLPLLLALACTPTAEITEQPSTTTAAQPSSTTEQPSTTGEPSADKPVEGGPVSLSQFETTLTVATGTELRYSFKSHASVGFGAKYEVGDPAVLEYVRTDMDYEQSEAEREGKTGADAATGTFVFKAIAPGSTTLKVTEAFRGDPQLEVEYAITVE